MHIDVADILRCPVVHEETWLVARVDRMSGRHIVDGILGCPICGAEWTVRDRIADFRRVGAHHPADVPPHTLPGEPDELAVVRAAAQLGLAEAGRLVLLTGDGGRIGATLGRMVSAHVLVADPAAPVEAVEHVSVLLTEDGCLPLAASSLHGALLDQAARVPAGAVVRALRPRGRLVAPAATPVPAEIVVLARDDAEWVGERQATASAPVTLRLAR